jgi:hypothetical protein
VFYLRLVRSGCVCVCVCVCVSVQVCKCGCVYLKIHVWNLIYLNLLKARVSPGE